MKQLLAASCQFLGEARNGLMQHAQTISYVIFHGRVTPLRSIPRFRCGFSRDTVASLEAQGCFARGYLSGMGMEVSDSTVEDRH